MNKLDQQLIDRVKSLDQRLMKPMFVFRMAMSQLDRPGAEKRAINAAKQVLEVVRL